MPQFVLYRIEDSYDGPVASLNIFKDAGNLKFEIRSRSSMIRDHLKQVLSSPFYQISPISYLISGLNANYALYIQPETRQYIAYLSDRLGWYGYILRPIQPNLIAKSIYDIFYEIDNIIEGTILKSGELVLKSGPGGGCSAEGGEMYYNKEGELVVLRVPRGCIAVSDDGRVVGPGKWLHARVDTSDSPWHLMELPQDYYARYTDLEAKYKKYNELVEQVEKEENEEKKKEYSKNLEAIDKAIKNIIGNNAKRLKRLLKKDPSKYSPAYHLVTSIWKKEEVETGSKDVPKVVSEFVEIDRDKLEKEFKVNFEEILSQSTELTLNPNELRTTDSLGVPMQGSAGLVNYRDAVYMNINSGIFAAGSEGMKRVMHLMRKGDSAISSDGWMFALPGEYEDLVDKQDTILELVDELLKNGKPVHPWLAGQYHAIKNGKTYGRMGGGFDNFAKEYNLIQDELRKLKIDREFYNRITSYVTINIPENSSFMPIENVRAEVAGIGDDVVDNINNREKRETLKAEFDQEIKKVMHFSEDGTPRLREDVSDIEGTPKTFADVVGHNNPKEVWNEEKYKLTREGSGNYQAIMAKWISNPKIYRKFGGPIESVGFDLNAEQGTGKTIMMLVADAAMREKAPEHFFLKKSNGLRMPKVTVIMAPNAPDWVATIKDARKEDVLYIDGPPEERQQAWEKLLNNYKDNLYDKIPKYIVIGTGKVRKSKEVESIENELGEDEEVEVKVDSVDITYLKMLASGFKEKTKTKVSDKEPVAPKGLIANFVLDEAGMFVNPKSTRTKMMRELRALITNKDINDGLFFTLNGEALSNSIDDTIYRLAYSNDRLFGNEEAIAQAYGLRINAHRQESHTVAAGAAIASARALLGENAVNIRQAAKDVASRVKESLKALKGRYINNFSLNSKLIVGKTGIEYNEINRKLEGAFKDAYYTAVSKYTAIRVLQKYAKDAGKNEKMKEIINSYSLGMLTILLGTSMGALNPRSSFEYGINSGFLLRGMREKLNMKYGENSKDAKKKLKEFKDQVQQYLDITTGDADRLLGIEIDDKAENKEQIFKALSLIGRVPLGSNNSIVITDENGKEKEVYLTSTNRQKVWEQYVDKEYRELLDDIVFSTQDVITETIAEKAYQLLKQKPTRGSDVPKLVIGGPSRIAMDKVVRRLKERLKDDAKVLYVNGDVSTNDRHKISLEHQTSSKPVVTVVTSAGARGLNLQSPNMISLPMWSTGMASQMHARARRNPSQDLTVHKVMAPGALSYVYKTERQKAAQSALLGQNIFGDIGLSKEEEEKLNDIETIEEAIETVANKISLGSILSAMIKEDDEVARLENKNIISRKWRDLL